jgi:hypothetical protein
MTRDLSAERSAEGLQDTRRPQAHGLGDRPAGRAALGMGRLGQEAEPPATAVLRPYCADDGRKSSVDGAAGI